MVASAYLMLALLHSGPQPEQGQLSIHVVIVDDLSPKPVAFTDFQAIQQGMEPVVFRTDAEGKAKVFLNPGPYSVSTKSPVVYKGKSYTWQQTITIKSGDQLQIAWNQSDAQITTSAPTRQISDEATLYQKYKESLATVFSDSGKGSAFVIDADKGLLVTNSHVVAGSLFIAVRFGPAKKVQAKLVAEEPTNDVAIIAVAPSITKGLMALPLLPPDQPLGVEGERILAIGSPLHQEKTLTLGIISKVEKDILVSDVNINPGNSGGPVLNGAGDVIGVATFADAGSVGPGISGIISIRKVQELLTKGGIDVSTLSLTEELLPDISDILIPDQMLKSKAETIKKSAPFLAAPRNFRTYIETPFDALASQMRYQKDFEKKIARRYKGKIPPDQAANIGPSYFWRKYVSNEQNPLVTIKVIPWPKETGGSMWGRALFGTLAGPAKFELRDDFLRLELSRDGKVVQPILRNRVRDTQIYYDYNLEINDTAMAGLYSYDPQVFSPGGKLEIKVWKNDGNASTNYIVDTKHQERVWGLFKEWADIAEKSR